MGESIRDYWIKKLLFPKIIVDDGPGVIINRTSKRYSSKTSRKRASYYFEDILVSIQKRTIEKIGKEETAKLWYKIGKDIGTRYILLSNPKKISSFLLPSVIDYIFSGFRGAGMSVNNKISFKKDENSLDLSGKNNVICRKSGEGSINAGVASAVLSFLVGKNIEAKMCCEKCPSNCHIVVSDEIDEKYIVDTDNLKPLDNYSVLNFPNKYNPITRKDSFSNFVRFKKIRFSNGKCYFGNKVIIPNEAGTIELIGENYRKVGKMDLFREGVISGAEEISGHIFKGEDVAEKLKFLSSIFCALGRGIMSYKIEDKNVILRFLYLPISKYKPLYVAYMLNGFLNQIFSKRFKLSDIKIDHGKYTTFFTFSESL